MINTYSTSPQYMLAESPRVDYELSEEGLGPNRAAWPIVPHDDFPSEILSLIDEATVVIRQHHLDDFFCVNV